MLPFLLNLFAAIALILCPTDACDVTVARTAVSLLRKGMTERQVARVLGETIYSVQMSSLASFTVYPQFRLSLHFSRVGGLTSAKIVKIEELGNGTKRFRYLKALPLD
jgi:hypothetical protein